MNLTHAQRDCLAVIARMQAMAPSVEFDVLMLQGAMSHLGVGVRFPALDVMVFHDTIPQTSHEAIGHARYTQETVCGDNAQAIFSISHDTMPEYDFHGPYLISWGANTRVRRVCARKCDFRGKQGVVGAEDVAAALILSRVGLNDLRALPPHAQ